MGLVSGTQVTESPRHDQRDRLWAAGLCLSGGDSTGALNPLEFVEFLGLFFCRISLTAIAGTVKCHLCEHSQGGVAGPD